MALRTILALAACASIAAAPAWAGKLGTLYGFGPSPDGSAPVGLISASGVLYGTTAFGGASGNGTIFTVNRKTGAESVLYSFAGGTDGLKPESQLLFLNGALYGTTVGGGDTADGGVKGAGVVFRFVLKTGVETVLHRFDGGNGGGTLSAGLTLYNGFLYGVTQYGGAGNLGTIFRTNPNNGSTAVVHRFVASEGNLPESTLVASGSSLYGTTVFGGTAQYGTVFRFDPPNGAITTLYNFTGADGEYPAGDLLLNAGVLYGGTDYGGDETGGSVGDGVVFRIDLAGGTSGPLHVFNGTDGASAEARMVFGNGLLYGEGLVGGASGKGTVFSMDPATGATTVLHSFKGPEGQNPHGLALFGGILYGAAELGGSTGCTSNFSSACGTVFKIAP